ncbi:MAG TPA: hypothetical protein VID67_04480 [Rhizomicrobium sp.]|jgi:hypothetical protein
MLSFVSSLGWFLIVVPLVVAVIGAFMFFRGIGHVATGEGGRGVPRVVVGAPLAVIGLAFGLLGVNTQTFERLSYEAPVAMVSVKAVDPAHQLFDVTVKRMDASFPAQVCRLQGDDWEMSARVQKWKPWANMLGLDATYTLDQMSNRYSDAERGNGKMITSCDLKGPPPAVNQWVPKSWVFWIVDHSYAESRHFGSGAYMPLADGAVYKVIMTQSGLNAEPANDVASKAKL